MEIWEELKKQWLPIYKKHDVDIHPAYFKAMKYVEYGDTVPSNKYLIQLANKHFVNIAVIPNIALTAARPPLRQIQSYLDTIVEKNVSTLIHFPTPSFVTDCISWNNEKFWKDLYDHGIIHSIVEKKEEEDSYFIFNTLNERVGHFQIITIDNDSLFSVELVQYLHNLWKQLDRLPIFEDETGCGYQAVALFYWICIIWHKKEPDLTKLFLKTANLLRSTRLRMLCNKQHFLDACKTFEDYVVSSNSTNEHSANIVSDT